MRVMYYNVFLGAGERLPLVIEVINEYRPDILGISEAVKWQDEENAVLKRFAGETGMLHHNLAIASTRHNIAILGKVPYEFSFVSEGFRHAVAQVVYNVKSLGQLAIFFLHLHPGSEDLRLKEIERILQLSKQFPHALFLGDYNSLSPNDPYVKEELLDTFRAIELEKFGTNALRFDVIRSIEKYGLVDVMGHLKKPFISTVPTKVQDDPAHATSLRLDYIFATPSLLPFVTDACVVKTPLTDIASDHYPLVADLSFE